MTKTEDVDLNALEDYSKWHSAGGMHLIDYATMKMTPDLIVAVVELFFPSFIEHKGAILIEYKFDESNFDEWFSHFNGNLTQLEKFLNTIRVADIFSNESFNNHPYTNIEYIGKKLEKAWRCTLEGQFPNYNIEVVGYRDDGYDDYIIGFWKRR